MAETVFLQLFKWMMLWYLTLARYFFLNSSAECLLVLFEARSLLNLLFKWLALMISAYRIQNYVKDENKSSISRIHISEVHSLLRSVLFLQIITLCVGFLVFPILSNSQSQFLHYKPLKTLFFFSRFGNHYLNHKKRHYCIHNVLLM